MRVGRLIRRGRLVYAFAFGDGVTGPQGSATASHTYVSAGSYMVTVTVTDTSGLTATASRTVTVNPAGPLPPTAKLSVSPSSGTAPLPVTVDAGGSSDPQGQACRMRSPSVTGRHGAAGVGDGEPHVCVGGVLHGDGDGDRHLGVDGDGEPDGDLDNPSGVDPTYVGTIANNYSTSTHTSGYVTVWRPAGVKAGDLVVLTLQLSGTSATGTVSGTDTAGNSYTAVGDVADGSGNRLVVLSGIATQALAANAKLS